MRRLHDYQNRAVEHLHSTGERGAGLFLDMGLGKTAVTLSALTEDHLPALVLAPKRVANHVWAHETQKWRPDLTVSIATGTPAQRTRARGRGADVTVMTMDTVTDLGGHEYRTVILDELSSWKTKTTRRWKSTRPVVRQADHVWGLTGTPSPNGYHDLWAQVALLDNGARLGPTLGAFRDRYFYPGRRAPNTNVVIEWNLKPGAQAAIDDALSDLCLAMRAEDYLATQKAPTFIEVEVDLPDDARRYQREMADTLVTSVGGQTFAAANSAVLSNKLLQLSAGFIYDDLSRPTYVHTEKTLAVNEIVEGSHRGVLVFYNYTAERDQLLSLVPGARLLTDPGVIDAWNRGEVPVMLAHPKSAGHGLNLQDGGHTIVYTSLPWSYELYAQSLARLARQGQSNAVMVYWLTASPYDKIVKRTLDRKEDVQTALMQYLSQKKETSLDLL